MTINKIVLSALFTATCLTPAAASAGSFYAFGDSLVDNGNITRVYGVPFTYIEGANAQYYYQSHFSNGPTWAEDLPGLTGLNFSTANDVAVGGAFTGPLDVGGTIYNNISNVEGLPVPLPSFAEEVASFAASGKRFAPGDVAGVWIGANNYFIAAGEIAADPLAAENIITGAVTQAIGQTSAGVAELIGLGARTLIVQNLPPLGYTPDFNADPLPDIEVADAISAAHDAALSGAMYELHEQTGANIIVVNEAQLFSELLANPAAYGKTNITDACVDTPSCRSAPTAVQNQYLFWDSVHPTEGTHLIIAEYTAADLNALRSLAVPAELAAYGAADFSESLTGRIDALRAGASGLAVNLPQQNMTAQLGGSDLAAPPMDDHRLSAFLTGSYDFGSQKSNAGTNGFTYNVGSITGGVDDRLIDGFVLGAAFGYGTDHATVAEGGATTGINAYQLGVYAAVTQPQFFLNSTFALGFDGYNDKRPGVLAGNVTAKPKGTSYDIDFDGGLTGHFGGLTAGPVAGINAAQVNIDSYTETGDAALTQSVIAQSYTRNIADIGIAASGDVSLAGIDLHPQGRLTANDLLSGNGGTIYSVFTDEPINPLTSTYATKGKYWGEFAASVSANITDCLSIGAKFETTFAKEDGDDHEVSGNLRYSF
jgi:outer membrane lipase/esterase